MNKYQADIDFIISKKQQFDYDYWTTSDLRLLKGSPYNAVTAPTYLVELGMGVSDPIIQDSVNLLFSVLRDDGRFKVYPTGAMYPCQTAIVLTALCRMGYANDKRLQKCYDYFKDTQEADGGWKCKKYSFGKGEETNYSTPLTTLYVLHAFLYKQGDEKYEELGRAIEFLLNHWEIKKPIGPCHYGIGTLFMQVEYPIGDYNIFHYVYVLSHYEKARNDKRFQEAFEYLSGKLQGERMVVERHSPRLNKLIFCKIGEPSEMATRFYEKIISNLST